MSDKSDKSDKLKKTCEKKFCEKYIKKVTKFSLALVKKLMDNSKIKIDDKKRKKLNKNIKSDLKKKEKELQKVCSMAHCNPTCKGTIFENGNSNVLPNEFKKQMKNKKNDKLIEMLIKMRKELFKDKKSIIKDGFYISLKKSTVKKIKKDGAISGCSVMVLP